MGEITIARWKAELIAGLLLIATGGFFLTFGLRLPPPEEAGVPGPGSAPVALGAVILLCGIAIGVGGLRAADREAVELGGRKQGIALLSLVLAAVLFEPAGFMLATFLFLAAGFVWLGHADWRRGVPAAAVVAVSLWLIFTKLLGVGLPYGLIGEALFR
jgi:putative tricarboxylic transport membrane protein